MQAQPQITGESDDANLLDQTTTNNSASSPNTSLMTVQSQTQQEQQQRNFTEKLRDEKSKDIKERMLRFIRDVQASKSKKSKLLEFSRNEIRSIDTDFHKIWQEEQQQRNENGEAIEAIMCKPLYEKLMSCYPRKWDKHLEKLFKIYDFIELEHLEIDECLIKHQNFSKVLQSIQSIDSYKTPRDKLIAICNSCKLISNIAAVQSAQAPIGADQILPILIYAILQSKPKRPFSNLEFIRDFRNPELLRGIEEYYFTSYESALDFIEDLRENKIKMNPAKFQKKVKIQKEKYASEFAEDETDLADEDEEEEEGGENQQQNQRGAAGARGRSQKNQKSLKEKYLESQEHFFKTKAKIFEISELYNLQTLKFYNTSYTQLTLGELQDFFREYHTLAKHYLDTKDKVQQLSDQLDQLSKSSENGGQSEKKYRLFGLW